ncbi:oxidative stress-induced growth inhibitor 2-like [Eupeodes corollae]|uniref:oxidative stress-induced growth inhibitor 2-like n=1 Tax=Eupeodes corollae TaxID=290404 RepID=UPI002492D12D|nr:oxidative stress-induced growth inhibitor 2-like [Eupeodes corollae]XP_055916930.1 oxidative stress-induced growth inhibitor 2-like [Eupeodes corollae]
MKDIAVRNIPSDSIYKDVVIIGNGPSGISLSYMLAGNWPYWISEKVQRHPDEMLRARLNYADQSKSLVEQDLIVLADGLEGRSTNPVSLLLDSLEHPCADLGMELPSMLEYRYDAKKEVDHIVLGQGPPGGSWHKMDPNLRTLSLAGWMSLPGLSYGSWEAAQLKKKCIQSDRKNSSFLRKMALAKTNCPKCIKLRTLKQRNSSNIDEFVFNNNNESEPEALCCKCTKKICSSTNNKINDAKTEREDLLHDNIEETINSPPRRNLSLKRQVSKEVQTRALVSRVAEYYEDYVHRMNLDRFFMNNANVTFIAPLSADCAKSDKFSGARWIVTGIDESTRRTFYFVCKNVVLANGVSDLPNRLGLRGEHQRINQTWVKHELRELETALENMTEKEREKLKPVLVVGAGLSAADAVTICRSSDVNVIHVYRSKSVGLDKSLPESVYPEYHEVHRMMKDPSQTYNCYTPVPEHTISKLSTDVFGSHLVTVKNLKTSETTTYEVSYCAILIGARPNLRFISDITKHPARQIIPPKCSYPHAEQYQTQMTRKLTWLKNICEKCKHFNICDWNRKLTPIEYRQRLYSTKKTCECNKAGNNEDSLSLCHLDDSGIGLGIEPTKPIDSKTNQIDVDKYTNEVHRMPKGLFAMGPLVGDNFVRFIPGGALAITSTLHQEND